MLYSNKVCSVARAVTLISSKKFILSNHFFSVQDYSSYIESLLLGRNPGSFLIDSNYQVLDGSKRLHALYDFVVSSIPLNNLSSSFNLRRYVFGSDPVLDNSFLEKSLFMDIKQSVNSIPCNHGRIIRFRSNGFSFLRAFFEDGFIVEINLSDLSPSVKFKDLSLRSFWDEVFRSGCYKVIF